MALALFCVTVTALHTIHAPVRPKFAVAPRRPAIATMLLPLPTCTPSAVLPLAATAGGIGALAQLGLTAAFKASGDPVWQDAPGYAAHQVVAFLLMIFVATLGLAGWLNPPAAAATAVGRLLGVSDTARWLGAMLLGMLVVWDIPTCIAIPRLRKPDMFVHHVAMAAVALVGCRYLPTHYGLYYMGVVEISSIPLTLYDLCDKLSEAAAKPPSTVPKERVETLRAWRDGARAVAAVCFIAVRAFDFTRVSVRGIQRAASALPTPLGSDMGVTFSL